MHLPDRDRQAIAESAIRKIASVSHLAPNYIPLIFPRLVLRGLLYITEH